MTGQDNDIDKKYGYSISSWNETLEEMRLILIRKAKIGRTLSYSELTKQITTIEMQPESFALAAMLGELSEDEDARGRGMLSVIVVHKTGDTKPGPGFFKLAEQLGRDISDDDKCWVEESNNVYNCWSERKAKQ